MRCCLPAAFEEGEDALFQSLLPFIGKLVAGMAKDLDAIVLEWIVRGRNHHPRHIVSGPGKIGHSRRAQHTREMALHALQGEPSGHGGGQPRAAFPRVHTDEDNRLRVQVRGEFSQSHAYRECSLLIEWGLAGNSPNPIRAK